MKNPWVVVISVIAMFVVAALVERLPGPMRLMAHQFHTDKIFHVVAGYLLMAIGITLLEIRDTGMVFLFALSVGAGWEVLQYLAFYRGFLLHEESPVFGSFESYADLVADMAGAFAYWTLHISGK